MNSRAWGRREIQDSKSSLMLKRKGLGNGLWRCDYLLVIFSVAPVRLWFYNKEYI